MDLHIDERFVTRIRIVAQNTGKSEAEVLEAALERGLPNTADTAATDTGEWKSRLLHIIEQLEQMPVEHPEYDFSGDDYDDVIYGCP